MSICTSWQPLKVIKSWSAVACRLDILGYKQQMNIENGASKLLSCNAAIWCPQRAMTTPLSRCTALLIAYILAQG
jgi:hypothetical protein